MNGFDVLVDLMNVKDRVRLMIMSSNNSSDTIDIYMKNENVDTEIHRAGTTLSPISDLDDKILMIAAVLGSIPFFGWMFRGFPQLALLKKLDILSADLKRISKDS